MTGNALVATVAPWKGIDRKTPPLEGGHSVGADLPAARSAQMTVKNPWNAQLPPRQWLFNPRVSNSTQGAWLVTCNTANGDLLELRGPKDVANATPGGVFQRTGTQHWEEERFLPGRLSPVVIQIQGQGRPLTAFLQAELRDNLYWTLSRYGGPDPAGNLMVEGTGAAGANLSAIFKLDSVRTFDMDSQDGKKVAIAAIHRAETQTLLSILGSIDGGRNWGKLASMPLQGSAGSGQSPGRV